MVFSSTLFLFLFLPVVLTLYALLPGLRARNALLLVVSLLFYAWGEVGFIFLLLGSTLVNWFLGLRVDREQDPARRKSAVTVAIVLNVGLLAFFKYANFAVGNANAVLSAFHLPEIQIGEIRLPIGISFFTFHALSYVVDIYRRKSVAARNPADTALYIFFFPQLIAGPILRWSAIAPQLVQRVVTREKFAEGIRRFVGGLAKKVIIANAVALPADQIFALPTGELTPALAWFGTLCYTVQIYFDFSGYSDMAVGLGKMFGFKFIENFDSPYISQSVKEFWRRWHISLSTWFRDYLYIPLGGNRCSETAELLQPRHRVFPLRAVARGELDVCRVGSLPRPLPRAGADSLRCMDGTHAARFPPRLRARRGDGRLGAVPRDVVPAGAGVFREHAWPRDAGRSHAIAPSLRQQPVDLRARRRGDFCDARVDVAEGATRAGLPSACRTAPALR